jgi:hypothetical protein
VLRVIWPRGLVVCMDSGAVVHMLLDEELDCTERWKAVSPLSPCWGQVALGKYDVEARVFRGGCFQPDEFPTEAVTTAYRRLFIDY